MVVQFLKFFLIISCCTSCSHFSYLWQQGWGQLRIQNRSISLEEALASSQVTSEHRDKILKIKEYKTFFFDLFHEKERYIYNRVHFLKDEAVSYLVTASPVEKIEPLRHCFIIVGCFPYLGFFSKKQALKKQELLREKNYVTWLRPVYAYSTLGYFYDPILSSFFLFDDVVLAEIIFHELVHTIFFIKSETSFNENLANFIAQELVLIYPGFSAQQKKAYQRQKKWNRALAQLINQKVQELQKRYQKEKSATAILDNFLQKDFFPAIKKLCANHRRKTCAPLKQSWNNARFAAYLTYNRSQEVFHRVFARTQKDFILFLQEIKKQYQEHKKNKTQGRFTIQ